MLIASKNVHVNVTDQDEIKPSKLIYTGKIVSGDKELSLISDITKMKDFDLEERTVDEIIEYFKTTANGTDTTKVTLSTAKAKQVKEYFDALGLNGIGAKLSLSANKFTIDFTKPVTDKVITIAEA